MISDGFHSTLQTYIDDVLSGRILTSKAVRATVERHIKDLARQSTSDFPYHFDPLQAAKVCRFFPTMLRHSIGRYAGMPFELSPFQVFCKSMIFGWLQDADKTRRFRRVYRSYGRKNGKSTDIAGESIYLAGFDRNPIVGKVEPVSQVVLGATKKDQVRKVIFAEARRMREKSPKILQKSTLVREEIRFPANNGEIIMVGTDKPFSGLNPHAVQLDEVHEFREFHRDFYDTMLTGSGSRDQPIISVITTAGSDSSYLWKEIYTYAKNVSLGIVEDNQYFSFIAELDEEDDPFDEDLWIKANPNLGVSVTLDYLRQQATEAKQCSIAKNRLIRFHCNRMVSATEQAFDMDKWDACRGELSDWSKADVVIAGFDLGGYDDLSAYALVARFPIFRDDGQQDFRYEVKVRAFISSNSERDLEKQPFQGWIYSDLLKKSDTPNVDLRKSLAEDCDRYGVTKVVYDLSGARSTAEELATHGLELASCRQNCSWFNEPIHHLMLAIEEQRFRHDGNPLLRWCAKNAIIIENRNQDWMYCKRDSADKIDPIVAMTMAFRLATLEPARITGSYLLT